MLDIVGRFIFVAWILSGMIMLGFALAGREDVAIYFGLGFLLPIVCALGYTVVKWIFTGKSE
jgi:hypothetical protein